MDKEIENDEFHGYRSEYVTRSNRKNFFQFLETKHPPYDINNMEGEKGGVNEFYFHRRIVTLVKS